MASQAYFGRGGGQSGSRVRAATQRLADRPRRDPGLLSPGARERSAPAANGDKAADECIVFLTGTHRRSIASIIALLDPGWGHFVFPDPLLQTTAQKLLQHPNLDVRGLQNCAESLNCRSKWAPLRGHASTETGPQLRLRTSPRAR